MHVHPGSWTAFLLHLEGLDYRRAMLAGASGVATHVVGARHVWRVRIGETESAGCRVTVPEDST